MATTTLKMILKGWIKSNWRLAFEKQVRVTSAAHVGKAWGVYLKKKCRPGFSDGDGNFLGSTAGLGSGRLRSKGCFWRTGMPLSNGVL